MLTHFLENLETDDWGRELRQQRVATERDRAPQLSFESISCLLYSVHSLINIVIILQQSSEAIGGVFDKAQKQGW